MPIYTRQYQTLPSLPGRGPLPPLVGVVVPLARTNLITNPSVELATTNYTAVGGSIARVATQQYHGAYSLEVTPSAGTNSDGVFYGTVTLTAATPYAYSVKFKATGAGIGKTYALSVATTGGVDLAVTQFVATGRWQWIRGVYGEASGAIRRIYARKVNHAAASPFYLDGLQVEACNDGVLDATTYIDGDQQGLLIGQQPPPYLWSGTPHASTSSRSAFTRAGGAVVNLSAYNFLLVGLLGLGMAVPNNVSIPYTILDGARFQRTQKPPRSIVLPGRFQADTLGELLTLQSDMRAVLDRDYVPVQQPLVLQVEPQDECGVAIGDFAQVQCLYAGGLEGNDGNYPAEDVAPSFTMYLPYLVAGDNGAPLTVQQSVANFNAIGQRSPAGLWAAMGSGAGSTSVLAMAIGPDGSVYAIGTFSAMGGVANTKMIARWDGGAWNAVGTGGDAGTTALQGIAIGPDGSLYVTGTFTSIGGVAANRIAKWNGSAWSALGTGLNGAGSAVAVGPTGDVYVAGSFTTAGGGAAVGIAKWNGSAWSALSTGLTGGGAVGTALAFDAGGNLYVGGTFTTAGGTAVNGIAKWNGSAFSALGTGVATPVTVRAVTVGPDNAVYIGGDFTTVNGLASPYIAKWNGASWSGLGSGVNNSVYRVFFGPGGTLYAGGTFTVAGSISVVDSFAGWNGSSWIAVDIDLPGTPIVETAVIGRDGTFYVGTTTTGTATSAALTTVTNDTPSIIYPKLTVKGPTSGSSRVYQIINTTTGVGVYFYYTINAGETAVFDFDPMHPSAVSTWQNTQSGLQGGNGGSLGVLTGDISSVVLAGSGAFYLAPGTNVISFFAADSTVTATLTWQKRYNGVADLVN